MFSQNILDAVLFNISSRGSLNAFCINEVFYNYSDFGVSISRIRKALQEEQLKSKNIGLVANDDFQTYAAVFALWLEGLAYVPLHPGQPMQRNQEIISQAGVAIVLSSTSGTAFPGISVIATSLLDDEASDISPKAADESDLAYILFTSGSTGQPKGVPITRGNIDAFMTAFWNTGISISETDRCLQCFDLTFDVSVQSFLVPLIKGACTFTIPHDRIKYSYVFGLLDDHQLTFGAMAPSMIRYLRPYFDEIDLPSMRYSILTAEASPLDLALEWSKCIPNAEIWDFYGPTEATIYCTCYKVPTDGSCKQLNGMLSIGKPLSGIEALILDENHNEVGQGEKGELTIAGDQLTPGYWNNPAKSAEVFFEKEMGGKMRRFYKTGDLCFTEEDGDILYAGRIDYQVKIHGYRIELGEIEHHAREFLKGQNAVVVPYENAMGTTELALFAEGSSHESNRLSAYLKSRLPGYMVPSKIFSVEVFPLNSNGKVDRNKLKSTLDGN